MQLGFNEIPANCYYAPEDTLTKSSTFYLKCAVEDRAKYKIFSMES